MLEQWYLWWAFTLLSLRLSSLFDLSWYPPTNDHPWPNMLLLAGPPYCFQTTPALIMTQRAITAEQILVWNPGWPVTSQQCLNFASNFGANSDTLLVRSHLFLLSQVRIHYWALRKIYILDLVFAFGGWLRVQLWNEWVTVGIHLLKRPIHF